jgi:hypothetical protein
VFADQLRLIDERSTAFRAAVASTVVSVPDATAAAPLDTTLRGTANELTLALYGRIPMDSLKIDGARGLIDLLQAW